jgi:hypothetical protein
MARSSGQAKETPPADRDVTLESIFGPGEPAGDDVFLSATEETVAMLGSVFGGDPGLFDGGFSLGFLSFG